jgi:hypothetical protein
MTTRGLNPYKAIPIKWQLRGEEGMHGISRENFDTD